MKALGARACVCACFSILSVHSLVSETLRRARVSARACVGLRVSACASGENWGKTPWRRPAKFEYRSLTRSSFLVGGRGSRRADGGREVEGVG